MSVVADPLFISPNDSQLPWLMGVRYITPSININNLHEIDEIYVKHGFVICLTSNDSQTKTHYIVRGSQGLNSLITILSVSKHL